MMASLCWNRLLVEGEFADRREFEVWNQTTLLSEPDSEQLTLPLPPHALARHLRLGFNAMVPVPFDLAMLGGEDVATWQRDNWGPQGNPVGAVERIDDGRRLAYVFHTDYVPPREWLFTVARKFQDLIFTLDFAEQNGACAGTLRVTNEEILEHVEAKSADDAEYMMRAWFGLDDSAFGPAETH